MKKLVFAFLAILISPCATAEWIRLGCCETNDADIYLDLPTLRKTGSKAKVWTLTNYKTPQGSANQFSSVKTRHEYDCEERLGRTIATTAFGGTMGEGHVIASFDDPDGKWSSTRPGSVDDLRMEVACDETTGKTKWTPVLQSGNGKVFGITYFNYIDLDTATRTGEFVRIWELTDVRSEPQNYYWSVKRKEEYDCKKNRSRSLVTMQFLANMGIGKAYDVDDKAREWGPVIAGSSGENFLKAACEAR